jgi:hypothetical protein
MPVSMGITELKHSGGDTPLFDGRTIGSCDWRFDCLVRLEVGTRRLLVSSNDDT